MANGCPDKGVENYSSALAMAKANSNAASSETIQLLMNKIIKFAEQSSFGNDQIASQNDSLIQMLLSSLKGRNYSDLLDIMPDPVGLYRVS
jgi:hypothetical protein